MREYYVAPIFQTRRVCIIWKLSWGWYFYLSFNFSYWHKLKICNYLTHQPCMKANCCFFYHEKNTFEFLCKNLVYIQIETIKKILDSPNNRDWSNYLEIWILITDWRDTFSLPYNFFRDHMVIMLLDHWNYKKLVKIITSFWLVRISTIQGKYIALFPSEQLSNPP